MESTSSIMFFLLFSRWYEINSCVERYGTATNWNLECRLIIVQSNIAMEQLPLIDDLPFKIKNCDFQWQTVQSAKDPERCLPLPRRRWNRLHPHAKSLAFRQHVPKRSSGAFLWGAFSKRDGYNMSRSIERSQKWDFQEDHQLPCLNNNPLCEWKSKSVKPPSWSIGILQTIQKTNTINVIRIQNCNTEQHLAPQQNS